MEPLFPQIDSSTDVDKVCDLFNENLRWLPTIASYSKVHPTNPSVANSVVQAKLAESVRTMDENSEDESQRMNVYKINRRKRYLAAQQRILDLYPDQNTYVAAAGDYTESRTDKIDTSAAVRPKPPMIAKKATSSNDVIASSSKPYDKLEFSVPSTLANPSMSMAQKVI